MHKVMIKHLNLMKNNKDRDIILIDRAYSESYCFMCYASKLFTYFINIFLVFAEFYE